MTSPETPFAPLSEAEVTEAKASRKKASDKTPIMPVPDDAPEFNFKIPKLGGAPKVVWAFRDREGRLLGYDCRFENEADGELQKEVLPVTFCDIGDDKRAWRAKAMPAPRALYGLDQLAQRPDAPVVVAEGCKSADAAAQLLPDYVAVSWSGGTQAVSLANWRELAGRDVLIWPDRDRQLVAPGGDEKPYDTQVGTIAAENISAKLRSHAASLRILDLEHWKCIGGWDAADALKDGWTPERAAQFIADHAINIDLAAASTVLPHGFEYGDDGLYHVGDEGRRTRIAGRLKVLAKTRNDASTSLGLLLNWMDDDGVNHRWPMPRLLLAGDGSAIRETLLDHGLFVANDGKARGRLMEFLGSVESPFRARAVHKVGWAGRSFVLPEHTVGDSPEDRILYQAAEGVAHQYHTAGTLEGWQNTIGRWAIGNSRLVFMISAALVGPVLVPACEESGGINAVGPSSCGKTTSLRAAASIWGPPDFIRQWRATSNALEGVAVQHNETVLCLDELGQMDPREAGPTAYMLGNGQGKSRATRTGDARAAATWKVLYLSTGEIGLAGLMADVHAGRKPMAGQEVRILDVPADAGRGMGLFENIYDAASPEAFARQITHAASENYGAASIAYLERLTGIHGQIGDMIKVSVAAFIVKHVRAGADPQVSRAARRFGLIAAAGELGIALDVLPWGEGEAHAAAAVMFNAWIARRGGTGSAEERNILAQVRAFIDAHADSRFSSVDASTTDTWRPVHNRAGFWRAIKVVEGVEAEREYLVFPEVFKTELCRGFDPTLVCQVLVSRQALRLSSENRFQVNSRLPEGLGQKKMYAVQAALWHDD